MNISSTHWASCITAAGDLQVEHFNIFQLVYCHDNSFISMNKKLLCPLEIRSILRVCYYLIQDNADVELWTAFQKHLLLTEQTEAAVLLRQLKKIDSSMLSKMKDGFSASQIESKLWLIDILKATLPEIPKDIFICGSWFGILSRMLHWGFSPDSKIIGSDLDPSWQSIARSLNEPESYQHKSIFISGNSTNLKEMIASAVQPLVINTSCEHFEDLENWYCSLPKGCLVALQANSTTHFEGHIHEWSSLSDFSKTIDLSLTLFEGQLELPQYKRYMLIGAK